MYFGLACFEGKKKNLKEKVHFFKVSLFHLGRNRIMLIFFKQNKPIGQVSIEGVWALHLTSGFSQSAFSPFFFFFWSAFVDFGRQILLLWTVYALFTHYAYTVHILKNIKNGSYSTIYTFKNYFAIVFSVFSFQFSVFNFSNNKFNPNGPIVCY